MQAIIKFYVMHRLMLALVLGMVPAYAYATSVGGDGAGWGTGDDGSGQTIGDLPDQTAEFDPSQYDNIGGFQFNSDEVNATGSPTGDTASYGATANLAASSVLRTDQPSVSATQFGNFAAAAVAPAPNLANVTTGFDATPMAASVEAGDSSSSGDFSNMGSAGPEVICQFGKHC